MIIGILIGREGSTGLPGKNFFPLAGRPMAAWPLLVAKHTSLVDRVYLSTDSPRLKELAVEYGAKIIDRPAHLCTNQALGEDVFLHAHQVIEGALRHEGLEPAELYVLLMANAPTVTPGMILEGVQALKSNPKLDSAVTVSRYNMWSPLRARKVGDDGLLRPFVPFEAFGDPKTLNCDRDSQGDVWFADMGVSIIRPRNLDHLDEGTLPQRWMGQSIYPIKNHAGLDVDYAWQIPQAEYWLRTMGSEALQLNEPLIAPAEASQDSRSSTNAAKR
jgi:hypothetical protein